jgi:GNAT superfamily N-acetyltransferase
MTRAAADAAIVALDDAGARAAAALSRAEGWNQTEADWARLVTLEPEGCFAIVHEGEPIATTTVTTYGRALAWIGQVVVDPRHRRLGLGRRLMERALAFADDRGIGCVKLDATDMGRPLYRTLGFEDEQPIVRWERAPAPVPDRASVREFSLDAALAIDRFGAERRALLAHLANDGESASIEGGFALGRAGMRARYFGPCVATSAESARTLAAWCLARHAEETVAWDILSSNAEAQRLAKSLGFEPRRTLMRMARRGRDAAPLAIDDARTFGAAGFEYG